MDVSDKTATAAAAAIHVLRTCGSYIPLTCFLRQIYAASSRIPTDPIKRSRGNMTEAKSVAYRQTQFALMAIANKRSTMSLLLKITSHNIVLYHRTVASCRLGAVQSRAGKET